MATIVNFKGKRIVEPGVYAQIKSGATTSPSPFSSGDLLIIDTGKGKGFGGGSGINGVNSQGIDSVYSFTDLADFQNFIKGGLFYDIADYIFNPFKNETAPQNVSIVKAATTKPATFKLDFATSGSLDISCKNEGEVGNGFLDEKLGVATLKFDNSTIIEDNNFIIKVDGLEIANYKSLSTSLIEFLNGLSKSINEGESGYTSEISNSSISLYSKRNSTDVDSKVISFEGTVKTTNDSSTKFVGHEDGSNLVSGYGLQIESNETSGNYVLKIFEGDFAGYTSNGVSINGLTESDTNPNLVFESNEFSSLDELIQILKVDYTFNKLFYLDGYILKTSDNFIEGEISKYYEILLASGGTEIYNPSDLDRVLEDIREMTNTFFLSDRFGPEAKSAQNLKILNHIKKDSEFDKFLIIGGGSDETKFDTGADSSVEIAKYFDDVSVILVHSGIVRVNDYTEKEEKLPSIYHAANVAGRLGGLQPQVPGTFKPLKIKQFTHPLGLKQREKALKYGVLHNRKVDGIGNVINQSINTIQNNTRLNNPDGTSYEISIMRIGAQLNKEIILNLRPLFVGNNWGMASTADVKTFVESYLLGRTVKSNQDNLIINFKNVTVRQTEDYYDVQYSFTPNGPLNKLFVTGFMLDANFSS